jgi:hypothetical protein
MAFDLAVAWMIAGTAVVALSIMGAVNKRNGMQRRRTDVVLDSLMLWAAAMNREVGGELLRTHVVRKATSDLAALQAATGVASAASPAGDRSQAITAATSGLAALHSALGAAHPAQASEHAERDAAQHAGRAS